MLPADVCIAGSAGKCVSGPFVVLDKPLLPFSGAAAACAKAGKKLATIDKIFGGTGAAKLHFKTCPPLLLSRAWRHSVSTAHARNCVCGGGAHHLS